MVRALGTKLTAYRRPSFIQYPIPFTLYPLPFAFSTPFSCIARPPPPSMPPRPPPPAEKKKNWGGRLLLTLSIPIPRGGDKGHVAQYRGEGKAARLFPFDLCKFTAIVVPRVNI